MGYDKRTMLQPLSWLRDRSKAWGKRQFEGTSPRCALHNLPLEFDTDLLGRTMEGCEKCTAYTHTHLKHGVSTYKRKRKDAREICRSQTTRS
jgi:hypothetical protein